MCELFTSQPLIESTSCQFFLTLLRKRTTNVLEKLIAYLDRYIYFLLRWLGFVLFCSGSILCIAYSQSNYSFLIDMYIQCIMMNIFRAYQHRR